MQMIRISVQTHITNACGATSKHYLRLGDFDDFKFGNCAFSFGFFQKTISYVSKKRTISLCSSIRFRQIKDSGLPRYCGLSFRKIGGGVGRNQTTVMRICDRWMQEGTTDRRGRSHSPQCTTSREGGKIVQMAVTNR
ncbi:uncharacterized protein TNCV_4511681 [Trichonephila clavipes]|nr:uncharacterized protein TNCV_4511681 [Trichonephila clavipes]